MQRISLTIMLSCVASLDGPLWLQVGSSVVESQDGVNSRLEMGEGENSVHADAAINLNRVFPNSVFFNGSKTC